MIILRRGESRVLRSSCQVAAGGVQKQQQFFGKFLVKCGAFRPSIQLVSTEMLTLRYFVLQAPWSLTFWLVYEEIRVVAGVGNF